MKTIILAFTSCFFMSYAFTQSNVGKETMIVNVPDFADPAIKQFYQSYADHLVKCIQAIRDKKEAVAMALFKDPGEQLVAKEKVIAAALVKNVDEKPKYIQFAKLVGPYIKELEGSSYFRKVYGK